MQAASQLCLTALLGLLVSALPAHAQDPAVPVEIGAHAASLAFKGVKSVSGAGVRVAIPLAPRAAIDARIALFPERRPPSFLVQGGKAIELQAGVRGAFVARRRFSVYGVLLPTLLHFTDVITAIGEDKLVTGSRTQVALDMGTGVDVRVAPHWTAYAEWTGPFYAIRGAEIGRSEPSPSGAVLVVEIPASVRSTAQFTAGVSYRAGRAPSSTPETSRPVRWTVGAQTGHTTYAPDFGGIDLLRSGTIGAFASRSITRWVDADGSFAVLLRKESVHSPETGGRVVRALGGAKIGTRSGRLGYFGKIRAGVDSHDSAVKSAFTPGQRVVLGRATSRILDFGAVIETYPAKRLVLRLDASDITTFSPFENRDSINVAIGFGWRFE